MKFLGGLLFVLLGNLFCPTMMMVYVCRINAMTFKSFTKAYPIRNRKLVEILIAEENLWGVSTSLDKRNKMSMLGIVSYILFLPQIYFYIYNIWLFITTGDPRWCELEQEYHCIVSVFYIITLVIKKVESGRYQKGEIW